MKDGWNGSSSVWNVKITENKNKLLKRVRGKGEKEGARGTRRKMKIKGRSEKKKEK